MRNEIDLTKNSDNNSPESITNKNLDPLKALIVEDELLVAQDLRNKLVDLGYIVVGVTASGREAIEFAKANAPDLVLMDFRITSDLNGPEAAVVIQGMSDNPVPIVFLTAYSVSEYPVVEAVDPYVYLRKPFSFEDLKLSLEKAVQLLNI